MIARLLDKFAKWALARNAPGGYAGEDDKRWAYTIETDGSPYLTRIILPWRIFGVRPYLHHFHRPDVDRWVHNHPWSWALSIVLAGSYEEERLDQVVEYEVAAPARAGTKWNEFGPHAHKREVLTDRRVVRWFNFLTRRDYHRVLELHGDVWTIFVTGPRQQSWGFLVDGKHVDYRDYFKKEIP